jgi:hypothetical protein
MFGRGMLDDRIAAPREYDSTKFGGGYKAFPKDVNELNQVRKGWDGIRDPNSPDYRWRTDVGAGAFDVTLVFTAKCETTVADSLFPCRRRLVTYNSGPS